MSLIISDAVFKAKKSEDIKDGMRITLRLLSVIMILLLQTLQIPLMVTYLQGYLCNEDLTDLYVLDTVCGSVAHEVSIALSTIALCIYLSFLVIQSLLYGSKNFVTDCPWGSLDNMIPLFKIALKLLVSACFTFNKSASYLGEF